jgi:hypothetical protein
MRFGKFPRISVAVTDDRRFRLTSSASNPFPINQNLRHPVLLARATIERLFLIG